MIRGRGIEVIVEGRLPIVDGEGGAAAHPEARSLSVIGRIYRAKPGPAGPR